MLRDASTYRYTEQTVSILRILGLRFLTISEEKHTERKKTGMNPVGMRKRYRCELMRERGIDVNSCILRYRINRYKEIHM